MEPKNYRNFKSSARGQIKPNQNVNVIESLMKTKSGTKLCGNTLHFIRIAILNVMLPKLKIRRCTQTKLGFSSAINQTYLLLILLLSVIPRVFIVDCNSNVHGEEIFPHVNNVTVHHQQPKELNNGISTTMEGLSMALGLTATTISASINKTDNTNVNITTRNFSLYQEQQPPSYLQLEELHTIQNSEKVANAKFNYAKGKLNVPPFSTASAGSIPLIYPDNNNIVNVINRDNVLKRHNSNAQDHHHGVGSSVTDYTFSSCFSCQMREKAKLDNLESIKMHILMRLQLSQLPNITAPIPVPHNILENFYKNYSVMGRRGNKSRGRMKPKPDISTHSDEFDYNVEDSSNSHVTKHTTYDVGEQVNHSLDDNKNIQNDDPNMYQNYASQSDIVDDYYNEDEFFSQVNSVYIFPTLPRIRHNRKPEILNFKFENNHSSILRTIVHIYLRGYEWIRKHEPTILQHKELSDPLGNRREIIIAIYRAIRYPNTSNYTHTIKLAESQHIIPSGPGQWVQIEVKQLSTHWLQNGNMTQDIIIKGTEPWMRNLIVTSDNVQNKPFTVHIEILTKDKKRRKRSTSLDCQESDHEVRCCRYPLKVNFTNFGWHFVVAPTSFDAYFCNGECKVGYLEQYTHTHIASLTTSASPCCSPTKMSPLSLLYFDLDQNLVWSTIPNMSVEKCSCS